MLCKAFIDVCTFCLLFLFIQVVDFMQARIGLMMHSVLENVIINKTLKYCLFDGCLMVI